MSLSQGHIQQQYNQSSGGSGGVDLSRLQPSPMDHLRPRQHNDPPWAPHHYIQKGKHQNRTKGLSLHKKSQVQLRFSSHFYLYSV